jgi:hypothetical protein
MSHCYCATANVPLLMCGVHACDSSTTVEFAPPALAVYSTLFLWKACHGCFGCQLNIAMPEAFSENWQKVVDGEAQHYVTLLAAASTLGINVFTSAPLAEVHL